MSKFKKILIWFIALVVIIGTIAGFVAYKYAFSSNVTISKDKAYFYIHTGATYNDVVDSLVDKSYLKNKSSFLFISKIKKYNVVKPGRYQIYNGESNWKLIDKLRSGNQTPVNVVVPSVRTIDKIAEAVDKYFEFDANDLLNAIYSDSTFKKYSLNKDNIAVLFIPNTYEMFWTSTPEEFVERMKQEYDNFWTNERKQKAKNIGLTQIQVSILASIVQSEQMQHAEERPIIAGLYLNRLRKGMPLQSDPTLIFAIGDFTIKRVYDYQKRIISPYNTYLIIGLPPGPILNPDVSSIDAVLNAQKNDYIYMCAREDFSGYHNFASNLTQHNLNAEKYHNALDKLKIK